MPHFSREELKGTNSDQQRATEMSNELKLDKHGSMGKTGSTAYPNYAKRPDGHSHASPNHPDHLPSVLHGFEIGPSSAKCTVAIRHGSNIG
jgi:hypothetical protein